MSKTRSVHRSHGRCQRVTLRVGVVSDIHLRSAYREEVSDELSRVVDRLGQFDPDLVVALGDIVEDETAGRDRDHIEQVREQLSFGPPLRMLAGNHDVQNLSLETLRSLFGNPLCGTVRIGGETLVFLNSASPRLGNPRGEIDKRGFDLLGRLDPDEPVTVFVHHPLHYRDLSETVWWSTRPEEALCGNKTAVNGILEGLSVRCVVNGHLHDPAHTRYREIDHVTLNAFSKETPDIPITGTYAEVEIGGGVRIETKVGDETVSTYEI